MEYASELQFKIGVVLSPGVRERGRVRLGLDLYNYIGTLNSDTLMPTRVLFYNLYKVFYLR